MCLTDRLLSADKSVYADLISVHLRVMGLRVITDKSFTREAVAESVSDVACRRVSRSHGLKSFSMRPKTLVTRSRMQSTKLSPMQNSIPFHFRFFIMNLSLSILSLLWLLHFFENVC